MATDVLGRRGSTSVLSELLMVAVVIVLVLVVSIAVFDLAYEKVDVIQRILETIPGV